MCAKALRWEEPAMFLELKGDQSVLGGDRPYLTRDPVMSHASWCELNSNLGFLTSVWNHSIRAWRLLNPGFGQHPNPTMRNSLSA